MGGHELGKQHSLAAAAPLPIKLGVLGTGRAGAAGAEVVLLWGVVVGLLGVTLAGVLGLMGYS